MKSTRNDETKMDDAIDAMLSLYARLSRLDAALDETQDANDRVASSHSDE